VSYSDSGKGLQGQATVTTAASTAKPSTGKIQASTSNNDSNSSDSNTQEHSEGAISGLSNLKRKLADRDKERELYKIEQTKMEDEISTVTNSLSKLGEQMIQTRQDMTACIGNMRVELAEMNNILLGMNNKKTASPRRKTHRRTKESEAASSSSNDEKIATAAGASPPEHDLTWDSMCETEAERNIRPPPEMVTLSTLKNSYLNVVDTGS
jgi:hypothetical protein